MYEFDAVSVSSFEAASLATTLTEKSADGWAVVAIVPAGSDVVAYLRRSTGADAAAEDVEVVEEGTDTVTPEPDPVVDTPAADTSTTDNGNDAGAVGWAAASNAAASPSNDNPWSSGASGSGASSGWGTQASQAGQASQASSNAPASQTASSGSWGGSSPHAAAATPAPTPQVPAGWYADPAGRFELRYWDGGAWTEHVSRAGQQYTDPPVA